MDLAQHGTSADYFLVVAKHRMPSMIDTLLLAMRWFGEKPATLLSSNARIVHFRPLEQHETREIPRLDLHLPKRQGVCGNLSLGQGFMGWFSCCRQSKCGSQLIQPNRAG